MGIEKSTPMRDYIIRRLLLGLLTLWMVSIVVFLFLRISGDPITAMTEPGATQEQLNALRAQWGLDKPLIVQYGIFILHALRGDFGISVVYRMSALELYFQRLPISIELAGTAFAMAFIFGVLMGILSALKVGGRFDTFGRIFVFIGLSIPSFWLGLMLIMVFSVYLKVLPPGEAGGIDHLVLPATALAFYITAAYMRLTRSSLLEVLGTDHINFSRIKGLPELWVVGKHALRNALIPVISYAGIQLALMINGGIVIEIVFSWPGTGLLLYNGILLRDYPLVQAIVLITATLLVLTNLMVDILYCYLDPRIKLR